MSNGNLGCANEGAAGARARGFWVRTARALPRAGLAMAALLFATGAWAANADLVLSSQDVSPDPVVAGYTSSIVITVENNGPDAASNVSLTDSLPSGATLQSITASSPGTCSGTTCSWASLPFQGTATATLELTFPSAGVYTNTASVSSDTPDANSANNEHERDITVVEGTDLGITASSSAGAGPIAAGTPYEYTLTVTNHGPDNDLPSGQHPEVRFQVPAGSSIVGPPSGPGWSCSPSSSSAYPLTTPAGASSGPEITCTRNDALAVGSSYPDITVHAVANHLGTITGSFSVDSDYPDGMPDNNTDTADVEVDTEGADLAVDKSVSPSGTVPVGTTITYTITPRFNGGTQPADIQITDDLPSNLGNISVLVGSDWACTPASPVGGDTLSCDWVGGGPLDNFSDLPVIKIKGTVDSETTLYNSASVSSSTHDPVPGNNTSSTVEVSGSNKVDLRMYKSPEFTPVEVGQEYQWSLRVRNHNGDVAVADYQTITVTDTLPVGMQLNTAPSGGGWTCSYSPSGTLPIQSQAGNQVSITCTRSGPLGVNAYTPYIRFKVENFTDGTLTNQACTSLDGTAPDDPYDSNSGNDCVDADTAGTDSPDSVDLSVTKVADKATAVAGEDTLTYTITVHNDGPADATSVKVTDRLTNLLNAPLKGEPSSQSHGLVSAEVTLSSTSSDSCSPAGPANGDVTVTCDIAQLAAYDDAEVTIVIKPNNSGSTTISRDNTATAYSQDQGDTDRSDNSGSVTTEIEPRVDVTVKKSVTPDRVSVGTPATYVVTVRNNGPSTALNVQSVDTMPANTAFMGLDNVSGGGSCATLPPVGGNGTLECSWTSMGPGSQQTVTYRLRPLKAAAGTTITNNVVVSTDSVELDDTNNEASASTEVTPAEIDILVHKTDNPDPVELGTNTTYTVSTTNVGPSWGTNLVITDSFPNAGNTAVFSYQGNLSATVAGNPVSASDLASACTEPSVGATSGTLTCNFDVIQPGNSKAIVLTYEMRADSITDPDAYSGTQGNHVEVAITEDERYDTNNDTDENTTTRRSVATDVALTKTIDRSVIAPGDEAVYTLTVTNNGPLESGGAEVQDVLPTGMSFVSSPDGCVDDSGTIRCDVGTLPVGDSKDLRFRVKLDDPYSGPDPVHNEATVIAFGDTDPSNNDDDVDVPVVAPEKTDLKLEKSIDKSELHPGDTATYSLIVSNLGSVTATQAEVVDDLPAGLSFVSSADGCTEAAGTVHCAVGSLAGGASKTLSFVVQLDDPYSGPSPIVNTAEVTSPGDTDPSNNEDSTPVDVVTEVDLELLKAVDKTEANAGDQLTYTLTVINHGPDTSTQGIVTDSLPAGVSFVSSPDGCSASGGIVNCNVGSLANGASTQFEFTVSLNDPFDGMTPLINLASVDDPNDTNPSNDDDSARTTVPGAPVDPSVAASICGNVYHDRNDDGVFDADEDGIGGVTIELYDDAGNLVATTTTDADGGYCFTGLRPGTYHVHEIQPGGWVDGKETVGTGANGNPGSASSNDKFTDITLNDGDAAIDYNFGEKGRVPSTPVPTVNGWGILLLMLALVGAVLFTTRRRSIG